MFMLINKIDKSYIETDSHIDISNDDEVFFVVDANSDLALKIKKMFPKFDFILDNDNKLVDVTSTSDTYIDFVKNEKVAELDNVCTQTIYDGIDITLSDNTVEHFTLTERDQLNLSGIALKLLMGAEVVAWHEDDEGKNCRFYNKADAYKFISELTTFKEYHITYFRDLRIYVRSLTNVDEVNNITYGFELPDEFKSDVLKEYEKLITENN